MPEVQTVCLKLNVLTEAQYTEAKNNGEINENELYFIKEETEES